uniref:GRAM domain-containing protein 4 isoform X2 n=1 Tax=Callithrix jacchus TaxID=9483 RepID=UPI0023DD492F|nr:GRAM domain-containing protein 4 isoform X2 [Callithrix jacchus]
MEQRTEPSQSLVQGSFISLPHPPCSLCLTGPLPPAERRSQGLSSRLQKWFYERFGEYVEDFRFQPEENTVETEEPLSARRLTENMRRLKRGAKPVTNFVKNLSALSEWYSVYTSAIAFTVYMNAVWHGWAIPLFLFLAILRLSLNYLIARGWRIQWSIVPEVSEPVEPPKEDLTVSEKFQLVLDVAQKAQNLFGKMADILEKIKNLFMWVQPEITQKLYVALWAAFLASCFFPYRLVGLAVGLYAGIKFFLIDFIFKRCPRLRAKYDTPYIIWRSLPTDPQLKERSSAAVSRRLQTTSSRSYVPSSTPAGLGKEEDAGRFHSTKKGNFHEIFNLTENERPLAVCENGWRCCLINRDRKMPTDYIRNGVLYVTENYLCFESSKSGSSKRNKVIKLVDITDIQKVDVPQVPVDGGGSVRQRQAHSPGCQGPQPLTAPSILAMSALAQRALLAHGSCGSLPYPALEKSAQSGDQKGTRSCLSSRVQAWGLLFPRHQPRNHSCLAPWCTGMRPSRPFSASTSRSPQRQHPAVTASIDLPGSLLEFFFLTIW